MSKILAALIATAFVATTAFAADTPKTETKAPEVKPAATAPAAAEGKKEVKAPAAKKASKKSKAKDEKTDVKTPEKHSKAAGHAHVAKTVGKTDSKHA